MRRLATSLVALAAVLLPVAAAFSHLDAGMHAPFSSREIVITGHDVLDPQLHIEALSGVRVVRCPQCVLEKRQAGAHADTSPALVASTSGEQRLLPEAKTPSLDLATDASPRAPPLV